MADLEIDAALKTFTAASQHVVSVLAKHRDIIRDGYAKLEQERAKAADNIKAELAAQRESTRAETEALAAERKGGMMQFSSWHLTGRKFAALQEERATMANTFTFQKQKVKLDVGGHRFSTTLATLTAVPGSYLATMFSGNYKFVSIVDTLFCRALCTIEGCIWTRRTAACSSTATDASSISFLTSSAHQPNLRFLRMQSPFASCSERQTFTSS